MIEIDQIWNTIESELIKDAQKDAEKGAKDKVNQVTGEDGGEAIPMSQWDTIFD